VIEFLCPNGHRIRCHAEQAGRAAKCPRCGVKFRVPDADDLSVSEPSGSDSKVSRPEFTESDRKLAVSGGNEVKGPQVEFLCPNGHRLHGAASLQGKPGQCPECDARFRIPTYDDISAEEKAESRISLGHADGREGSSATRLAGPTMAALVARLWELRPQNGTVELRLRDGEIVVPDQFLKRHSQQGQAVFTVKEADGSLSLVAIAWDAVAAARVRGLSEVPKELAE
jgi:hypothetical protein